MMGATGPYPPHVSVMPVPSRSGLAILGAMCEANQMPLISIRSRHAADSAAVDVNEVSIGIGFSIAGPLRVADDGPLASAGSGDANPKTRSSKNTIARRITK